MSTAHVSLETSELIEKKDPSVPGYLTCKDFGWIVTFPDSSEFLCEMLGESTTGCPELLFLMGWAHALGFNGIEFDADAEILKELPTYDW